MESFALIVVIVLGLAAFTLIGAGTARMLRDRRNRRRRAERLRERFGPEYDLAVRREGQRDGEHALEARIERYGALDHPTLPPHERKELSGLWRRLQFTFIDAPECSVREAEHLVVTVMDERGFPTVDGAVRADALSVEDPDLADSYRAAHRAFCLAELGRATTDQLLGAVLTYRELFERLLERAQRESSTFDADPPDIQALPHLPAGASASNR